MPRSIARALSSSLAFIAITTACSDNPGLPTGGTDTGKLTMLNALTSATSATLKIDGEAAALPSTGTSGTADLTAGSHQLQIYSGNQLLVSKTLLITANSHRTAVLSGTAAQALLLVNTLDTAVVPLVDAGKMRLVHTVPDAPSTDAYVFLTTAAADSSARFITPFTYGSGTDPNFPGYAVRPPGQYLVWLKASGTNTVLVQGGPFTVNAGDVYSFVLARNDAGALEIRAVKEH